MSYTTINFKTKKEVKEALSNGIKNFTGVVYLEGPHYPKPHKWYASGKMENGILKDIK